VLSDLAQGKPWAHSGHFPRYTVQCTLLINIINEKVFAFFWCWYFVLAVVTTSSALFWFTHCVFPSEKVDYVLKYMQIAEANDRRRLHKMNNETPRCSWDTRDMLVLPNAYLLDKFVMQFLKSDGIFTLRMMASHAGELMVVQVVRIIWKEFCQRNWREIEEYEGYKCNNNLRAPPSLLHSYMKGLKPGKLFKAKPHIGTPNHVAKADGVARLENADGQMTDSVTSEKTLL
ncbi:Innexin-19, partial [Aphelenchoides avenae]